MGNISFPKVQQLIYSVNNFLIITFFSNNGTCLYLKFTQYSNFLGGFGLYYTRVDVVFLTLAIYSSYCKDYRQ